MVDGRSFGSELRGRLWSNHFDWQSLFDVGHAPVGSIGRRADLPTSLTGHPMSFDRLFSVLYVAGRVFRALPVCVIQIAAESALASGVQADASFQRLV